jgi:hypothetical protein
MRKFEFFNTIRKDRSFTNGHRAGQKTITPANFAPGDIDREIQIPRGFSDRERRN